MSKLLAVIHKNFKFLMHHKLSTVAIILGPIILIILAGIAFNSTQLTGIKVGIHSDSENVKFMEKFEEMLSGNDFQTISYATSYECQNDLEKGLVHVCTLYNSSAKKINFVVDSSKINLAYAILSVMSEKLDVATEEMGFALTSSLLKQVNELKSFIDTSLKESDKIVDQNKEFSKGLMDMSNELYSMEISLDTDFNFNELKSRASSTNSNIDDFRDLVDTQIDSSMESLNEFDVAAKNLQNDIDDKAEQRDEMYDYLDETYQVNSCTSTNDLTKSDDLYSELESESEPECTVIYTLRENIDACTGDLEEARAEIDSLRDTID